MTQYEIKPQAGYMVVEPIPSDEFNKSIIATVEDTKRISTGKVIAVSKYAGTFENYGFQYPTEVKAGDTVAYIEYTEHPLKVNGTEYHIVRFDKVTATIVEVK